MHIFYFQFKLLLQLYTSIYTKLKLVKSTVVTGSKFKNTQNFKNILPVFVCGGIVTRTPSPVYTSCISLVLLTYLLTSRGLMPLQTLECCLLYVGVLLRGWLVTMHQLHQ